MNKESKTLLVDCGNSYLKWSLLDADILGEQQSELHKDASVLEVFKNVTDSHAADCDSIVMVSVLGDVFLAGAKKLSEDAGLQFYAVQSVKQLAGIINAYHEPEKLGTDRLVAMLGAYQLVVASAKPLACIVIDSGTATTIDAVDETGQHLGGVIFPGLQLSMQSLSSNTEQLPLLDVTEQNYDPHGLATDTSKAISSGCLLSLAGGIDGICNKMHKKLQENSFLPDIAVTRIICGGGAKVLMPHLENNYDYHDNLIMLGLQKIRNENLIND